MQRIRHEAKTLERLNHLLPAQHGATQRPMHSILSRIVQTHHAVLQLHKAPRGCERAFFDARHQIDPNGRVIVLTTGRQLGQSNDMLLCIRIKIGAQLF